MARRTHFSFERTQRDRAKVAKREAKRAARAARKASSAADTPATGVTTDRAANVTPGPIPLDE